MRTYIAKHGSQRFRGGLSQCIEWGFCRANTGMTLIYTIRGGERDARAVIEIGADGSYRQLYSGQRVRARRLRTNG